MQLEEYNFNLSRELIAKYPLKKRDESRLLWVDRERGEYQEKVFSELGDILKEGDCLVLNKSRVFPARLSGKNGSNGRMHEVLLVKDLGDWVWEVLIRGGKYCVLGDKIDFGCGLWGKLVGVVGYGAYHLLLSQRISEKKLLEIGRMGLPPYILKLRDYRQEDLEDYQTVYSESLEDVSYLRASIACPTAGRHFTEDLLRSLQDQGVELAYVHLDISLATFQVVSAWNVQERKLYSERYVLLESQAKKVMEVLARNGRVIAVGTSSTRVLESCYDGKGLRFGDGETDLFIYPEYSFKVLKGLVTNFHMPKSSAFLLTCALGGELVKKAYSYAIEKKFRFYSYGDVMILL